MKLDQDTLGRGGNPMAPECMRTLRRAVIAGGQRRTHIGYGPEDDPQRAAFIAAKLQELHAPHGSDPAPRDSRRT